MKRMDKRGLALCLATCLTLSLTGCGNAIAELTDEEAEVVGEYAAVTLLKYDANHRSRLVDTDMVIAQMERDAQRAARKAAAAEETASSEADTGSESGSGEAETTVVEQPASSEEITADLDEVFAIPEGVNLVYTGYTTADTYPEDDSLGSYFTLDASAGKKLLVLYFMVTNDSDADVAVDTFSANATCRISVNDGVYHRSLQTMLPNDLSAYQSTLAAGSGETLVLLAEIDEETAGEITSMSFRLKNDGIEYTIKLL